MRWKVSGMDLKDIDIRKADLHIHTYYSDGRMSPADIVREAGKLGYTVIAITDHDGTDGVEEALEAGRRAKVAVIPGIELDTETDDGTGLHILGYGMDVNEPVFRGAMEKLAARRKRRNAELVKVLTDMGYSLSMEELERKQPGRYIGKPVIARALEEKGYIPDYRDAFKEGMFLESRQAKAVKKEPYSSREAIDLIKGAGGAAVLAHPIQTKGLGRAGSEEFYAGIEKIVTGLKDVGLEGLECYHPDQDRVQSERFCRMADAHGLWITRGSDFHGDDYSDEKGWIESPWLI